MVEQDVTKNFPIFLAVGAPQPTGRFCQVCGGKEHLRDDEGALEAARFSVSDGRITVACEECCKVS